ncbi:MAG: hypothetical protein WC529_04635 [Candidatus Margulisiibacteriota bacterium]
MNLLLLIVLAGGAFAASWSNQAATSEALVNAAPLVTGQGALAVGAGGLVAGTSNYGAGWNFARFLTNDWRGVNFYGTIEGFMVGANSKTAKITFNQATGTFAFEQKADCGTLVTLRNCYFLPNGNGWAAGDNPGGSNSLYTYTAATDTWTQSAAGVAGNCHFRQIAYVSPNILVAVGGLADGSAKVVYGSGDGGANWIVSAFTGGTGYFNDVQMFAVNSVWAAGDGGAVFYYDGAWNSRSSGIPATTDIKGIHFTDPDNGWAVGSSGEVYRTTNGTSAGAGWSRIGGFSAGTDLLAVNGTNESSIWIAGSGASGGTLYKYVIEPAVTALSPARLVSSTEAQTLIMTIEGTHFLGLLGSSDLAPAVAFSTVEASSGPVRLISAQKLEALVTVEANAAGNVGVTVANPDGGVSAAAAWPIAPARLILQNIKFDGIARSPLDGTLTIDQRNWSGQGPTLFFEALAPTPLSGGSVSGEVTIGATVDAYAAGTLAVNGALASLEARQFSASLEVGAYTCIVRCYAAGEMTSETFTLTVNTPTPPSPAVEDKPVKNAVVYPSVSDNPVRTIQYELYDPAYSGPAEFVLASPGLGPTLRLPVTLETGKGNTIQINIGDQPRGVFTGFIRQLNGGKIISKKIRIVNARRTP